jgi:hypothetical protein
MPGAPEKTTTESPDLPGAQATKRDRWSSSGVVPNSSAVSGMSKLVKHLNLTSAIPRSGRTRFAPRRILGRSAGRASRLTRGQSELPTIEVGFARFGIYRLRLANHIIQGWLLCCEAVGALPVQPAGHRASIRTDVHWDPGRKDSCNTTYPPSHQSLPQHSGQCSIWLRYCSLDVRALLN